MSTKQQTHSPALSLRDKLEQLGREREVLIAQRDLARAGVRSGMALTHARQGWRGRLVIQRSGPKVGIHVLAEDGSVHPYDSDWQPAQA